MSNEEMIAIETSSLFTSDADITEEEVDQLLASTGSQDQR